MLTKSDFDELQVGEIQETSEENDFVDRSPQRKQSFVATTGVQED
jgi:hypothetical protein